MRRRKTTNMVGMQQCPECRTPYCPANSSCEPPDVYVCPCCCHINRPGGKHADDWLMKQEALSKKKTPTNRRSSTMRETYEIEIKIDKGIPMPSFSGKRKYPWLEMEVGDSFLFPRGMTKAGARATSSSASRRYAPKKFRTKGNRCWRVK